MVGFRIAVVFVLLTIFCSCQEKQTVEEKIQRPNVLLLYMDDLRPQLGIYGANQMITPHLDQLAAKGTIFSNAYCNVPVCGASRASMLTGMLPNKDQFLDYKTFVEQDAPEAITLPQLFKKNGYTTISNGKIYHHLDDRISDWDEIYRPYAFEENDEGLSPTDCWQSIWKDYQTPENRKKYQETGTGPAYESAPVADSVYIDGMMTEKVLRDLQKIKNSERPFFLTAGFISPHLPFNAPKKYWDLYNRDDVRQPENYDFIPENAPNQSISNWFEMRAYSNIPKKGEVPDSLAIDLIHGYYATVSYTDALVGKIMDELKRLKLDQSTIVVLVSDHGYHLQEHTMWAKFTPYRVAAQVPLVIVNPLMEEQVDQHDSLLSLVDLYPTLSELCDLNGVPSAQLDGKSFVFALSENGKSINDHVFIKRGNIYTIKTSRFAYSEIINDQGKIIGKMLYDHENDPEENRNVVNKNFYVKDVKILHDNLWKNYVDF